MSAEPVIERRRLVDPRDACPYCGHNALDDHDSRAMDAECFICHAICRAPAPGDPVARGSTVDFIASVQGFLRPYPQEMTVPEWLVTTQSGQLVYVIRAFDRDKDLALVGRLAWRVERRHASTEGGQS